MKFKVKVHANSSKEKIEEEDNGYEVWLKEKPTENKANIKLVKILTKHLKQPVEIISGFTSKNKIIKIK